jgi:hypothetical protein
MQAAQEKNIQGSLLLAVGGAMHYTVGSWMHFDELACMNNIERSLDQDLFMAFTILALGSISISVE